MGNFEENFEETPAIFFHKEKLDKVLRDVVNFHSLPVFLVSFQFINNYKKERRKRK